MNELQNHPLAEIFPLMEGADFRELVEDIRLHGLREPITVIGEQILDGRNRHRACQEAGIEPSTVPYEGADPLQFVVSKNLIRRHLKDSQRCLIAARLVNSGWGGDSKKKNNPEVITRSRAAQLLNVSEHSLKYAVMVRDDAGPELVGMIERGQVSISAAAAAAHLDKPEQAKLAARGSAAVVAFARRGRPRTGRDGRAEYKALWTFVDRICDALEEGRLDRADIAAKELSRAIGALSAKRRGGR